MFFFFGVNYFKFLEEEIENYEVSHAISSKH